jgi:putative flavoprotein involved in K+ transport
MKGPLAQGYGAIIVGGGQAGLSVSYCLKERGVDHVVLERSRIGNSWRTQRWDSFCLVTPNWQCQLPGHPYEGPDPDGFMRTPEIVDYLESYVAAFRPPVLEGVEVLSVQLRERGVHGFDVSTSSGQLVADQLVVATGGYHAPRIPKVAVEFAQSVFQVHSSEYRNPESLPVGEVLVVGTGQSGCQIAEDLHLAGRKVHLSVGSAPRCARRYRGKDVVEWLHRMGHYDTPIDDFGNKAQVRDKTNHYVTGRDGGHDIDLRRFALEGMRLYGPLEGIHDGQAQFAPGLKRNLDSADDVYRSINRSIDAYIEKHGMRAPPKTEYVPPWEPGVEIGTLDYAAAGIRSVVWAAGFETDFGWLKLPVFGADGYPQHVRGVTPIDGLYFIGLPWLFTWGSGRFCGVGSDASHLADRIVESRRRVA